MLSFEFILLNILMISFTTSGSIDKIHTIPHSFKLKAITLKTEAKGEKVITMFCRNIPSIMDNNKYLFVNNPTWNIDFFSLLRFSE